MRMKMFLVWSMIMGSAAPAAARTLPFDKAIKHICAELQKQLPPESRVWVSDLYDLDGRITYFGRYLSDKIQIALARDQTGFVIVDRTQVGAPMAELELQQTGLVDETTMTKMGKMVGASVIVYGTVTDLPESIEIDVKLRELEGGTAMGGISQSLQKDENLAHLVNSIIQTEKDKEKELADYREQVLREIEEDRQKKLKAIGELDKEIRLKSIVIAEFEAKRKELEQKSTALETIHAEIGRLNRGVTSMLKIGMTRAEARTTLELGRELDDERGSHGCFLVGKYFLLFEGEVLSSVVLNGSLAERPTGRFFKGRHAVHNCSAAWSYGKNLAK